MYKKTHLQKKTWYKNIHPEPIINGLLASLH